MAAQPFGAGLQTHVYYHILISDGVWFPGDRPAPKGELRLGD